MVVHLENYASPQTKLVNELVQAMVEKNMSLFAKHLHKDYRHIILPQSLGKPPINRDEWLATIAEILSSPFQFGKASYTGCYSILTQAKSHLQPSYHSVVEAPGKAVVHVRILIHSG